MAQDSLPEQESFLARVDAFWDWFQENERTLAGFVEDKTAPTDQVVAFITRGTGLISEDINFNIGGGHEFTFAVDGNESLFYLLPYLVSRCPEALRDRWSFYPCMQSAQGKSFQFGMYGQRFDADQVLTGVEFQPEQNQFSLRFYHPGLCELEEEACYNAFYIMMDIMVGEVFSRLYIGEVQLAREPEEGMRPLTQLEGYIVEQLGEQGQDLLTRLDQRYTVYQFEPQKKKELRFDVIGGSTCFPGLVDEYYAEQTDILETMDRCGAKAVFLAFPYYPKHHRQQVLEDRHELEDRLEQEILGERAGGEELGLLLGAAMGEQCAYIDLLLYDEAAVLERIGELLESYPYAFYLSEFKQGSSLRKLTDGEQEEP